jgi:hypothetical protein
MEGPSLYLAANQLKPFKGKTVLSVSGNSKIEKERMLQKKVKNIFAWGKHLITHLTQRWRKLGEWRMKNYLICTATI